MSKSKGLFHGALRVAPCWRCCRACASHLHVIVCFGESFLEKRLKRLINFEAMMHLDISCLLNELETNQIRSLDVPWRDSSRIRWCISLYILSRSSLPRNCEKEINNQCESRSDRKIILDRSFWQASNDRSESHYSVEESRCTYDRFSFVCLFVCSIWLFSLEENNKPWLKSRPDNWSTSTGTCDQGAAHYIIAIAYLTRAGLVIRNRTIHINKRIKGRNQLYSRCSSSHHLSTDAEDTLTSIHC